ncbi:T9SS type A sorting domain-containing protein [Hymenobacter sp. BT635]|uniref:T9SS type A sorting domain-containing protein n=1 Tax=Hymenobacter nitidus TaxID=2880929 RepID=A0ABS8ACV4_9BACT|nr:T9SS type A sorting domain-containing protein [Hymenobacter nitidus]MCB2377984.1 T9SS type A sorting domain-containing protein [Hymenobacter nitidus]
MPNLYFPARFLRGLLLTALLTPGAAFGQSPTWHRAAAVVPATRSWSRVDATAADGQGFVYLAGSFSGTIQLDGTTLTSSAQADVFIAKWNSTTNTFVWAQRAGGRGNDNVRALAVQGSSVYVGGSFDTGRAGFGSDSLDWAGGKDGFVCKLTDAGTNASFAWSKGVGSTRDEEVTALAATPTGLYLTGMFSSPTLSLEGRLLTNAAPVSSLMAPDLFVAKLTDAGTSATYAWAERTGGPSTDEVSSMAVEGSNVYLHGSFYGLTSIIGTTTLTNSASSYATTADLFVAKLTDQSSAAAWGWVLPVSGPEWEYSGSIAAYGSSVYVTGTYANKNTIRFGNSSLTGTNNMNCYVAKLTDAGAQASWQWVQGPRGDSSWGNAIQASAAGVFVAGMFSDGAARSITLGSTVLASPCFGCRGTFVAGLTDMGSSGRFSWAVQPAGASYSSAAGLAISGNELYIGGNFQAPFVQFGTLGLAVPLANERPNVGYVTVLRSITTSMKAPAWAAGLELTPNPAHGRAMVSLPAVPGATRVTLLLTDALGRTVRTATAALPAAGLRHELNLQGLAPGLYSLRVQAGQQQAVRALLVE